MVHCSAAKRPVGNPMLLSDFHGHETHAAHTQKTPRHIKNCVMWRASTHTRSTHTKKIKTSNIKICAGDVALWWRAYSAYRKPWVQCPACLKPGLAAYKF